MAIIRFGLQCDRCKVAYANYNEGSDVATCDDCQKDLCASCAQATGHRVVREADEGRHPVLACAGDPLVPLLTAALGALDAVKDVQPGAFYRAGLRGRIRQALRAENGR